MTGYNKYFSSPDMMALYRSYKLKTIRFIACG